MHRVVYPDQVCIVDILFADFPALFWGHRPQRSFSETEVSQAEILPHGERRGLAAQREIDDSLGRTGGNRPVRQIHKSAGIE